MNLYGVVTGTNDYSLNVSFPNSFRLSVGDTITIRPLNANTGASTLDVGFGPMSLTLNGAALTSGQLEANKDRQCTFIGSGFALDSAAGGGASFVGTSSNLTLGDGSAGIVPAGNFGNLSAADITAAGAQAAITGIPTGSKFARDTGAWSAIAYGDLPTALEFVAVVTNGQSVPSGSAGKMNLDTATINTIGTVSSSVITINAGCGGEYDWECTLLGNNSNVAELELDVSGSRFGVGAQTVSNQGFRGVGSVKLVAGDTVTLKAGSGGGTTLNTGAAGYQTFRMVRKL